MRACVYPGSFDPFTNGHLNIVWRAGNLFDKVVVLISPNSEKKRFTDEYVMKVAIEKTLEVTFHDPNKYQVDILRPGLSVLDYMSNHREELDSCMNIIRGIRDGLDAMAEHRLYEQYKWFSHEIRYEVIPLFCDPIYRSVSSSLVREMYKMRSVDAVPVPLQVEEMMADAIERANPKVAYD